MDESLIEKVKEMIAAPSCYEGLKAIGQEWLEAVGTDREKEAGRKLVAELEEDVQPIENVIDFFHSADGVKYFGAETAASIAKHAEEVKANGGVWCDCPACAPGKEILDRKAELL